MPENYSNLKRRFQTFDAVLCTYIEESEDLKNLTIDNDWWFASELGRCLRSQVFRRLGAPKSQPINYAFKMLANDGIAAHNWREEAARKMNCILETETHIRDENLRYKGRFDLLAFLNNELYVIDIKTQNPKAFSIRKQKSENEKIEEFQKRQIGSYIYFMKRRYPMLNKGLLYYYDRAYGEREEYIFELTDDLVDKILGELNMLNSHWADNKIPVVKRPTWNCKFCPYKKICIEVDKNSLTINNIKEKYGKL